MLFKWVLVLCVLFTFLKTHLKYIWSLEGGEWCPKKTHQHAVESSLNKLLLAYISWPYSLSINISVCSR